MKCNTKETSMVSPFSCARVRNEVKPCSQRLTGNARLTWIIAVGTTAQGKGKRAVVEWPFNVFLVGQSCKP